MKPPAPRPRPSRTRFAVVAILSGEFCGVVAATDPEEACQIVDCRAGRHHHGYAAYGPQSGIQESGRPGYFVHRIRSGAALADPAALIAASPRVAIVLTRPVAPDRRE